MQSLLERVELLAGEAPLRLVGRQKEVLDAARRAPGAGKADGRTNADDAVNSAVGFLDGLDHIRRIARQIGNRRVGVLDLAFERRDEALAYPAETLGVWIDGHDCGSRTTTSGDLHAPVNIVWIC